MREVTPKELQKLNNKSFKETQRFFRRRLRETAADGDKEIPYNPNNYACGDQIKPWLEGLGFTVKQTGPFLCRVTWPESLTEMEVILLTKPVAAKTYCHPASKPVQDGKPAWYLHHWTRCPSQWDCICSCCNEHSEYATKFCPNCGAKMHLEEDNHGTR